MSTKPIHIILGISLSVFVLMGIMNFTVQKPNTVKNGFNRKFINDGLTKVMDMNFHEPVKDIAGVTDSFVYIVTEDPYKLIQYNRLNQTTQEFRLMIPEYKQLASNFTMQVKYPLVHIIGSNIPGIINYNLLTKKHEMYKLPKPFSRNAVQIGKGTFVIRIYDSTNENQYLKKIETLTGKETNSFDIIEQRDDAGFSTSGQLTYDEYSTTIIYTHFYSNRVYFLDTNLKLIREDKTIDTFRSYQAQGRVNNEEGKVFYGYATPPNILNLFSYSSAGLHYALSNVKADNQKSLGRCIDIYNIQKSNYLGTYDLPDAQERTLENYVIFKEELFAVKDSTIDVFQIKVLLQ